MDHDLQRLLEQAVQLHEAGRIHEAIGIYAQVLPHQQTNARLLFLLGTATMQIGQYPLGIDLLERSLMHEPGNPSAHFNQGNALGLLHRLDEAVAAYDRALALWPDYTDAHNNRGNALRKLKRPEEALAAYERALTHQPDHVEAHNNRGNVLQDLERLDEALVAYERALALNPGIAEIHSNHGNVLRDLGRLDQALAAYDRALALNPEYAEVCWNKALLLIQAGRYAEGWALYEWRLKTEGDRDKHHRFPQPAWRGREDIRGKRILVYGEQGFGDAIQFCRYLPQLKSMGADIVFVGQKALLPLVSTMDCPMTLVAEGEALPAFDVYCPLMSLPHAFGTTVETIPAAIPYLHADESKAARWRQAWGATDRLRVGLAWSGAAMHKRDAVRSMPLEALRPLIGLPAEFHSLQVEYRERDLECLGRHPQIRRHQHELHDFADTAALIACMDLIISVDTGVAHLAGAMGKPVWILLPFASDYRWMLGRGDSPWYPTARLFRQSAVGDWSGVVAEVGAALQGLMASA